MLQQQLLNKLKLRPSIQLLALFQVKSLMDLVREVQASKNLHLTLFW
jgi:hypothetical protein